MYCLKCLHCKLLIYQLKLNKIKHQLKLPNKMDAKISQNLRLIVITLGNWSDCILSNRLKRSHEVLLVILTR